MMDLGQKLKGLREAKRLTQLEVAQHIKKSKQMVSLYESGINTPPPTILASLLDLYGGDQSDLVEINNVRSAFLKYYRNPSQERGSKNIPESSAYKGVPFFDIDAFAQNFSHLSDNIQEPSNYINLPGIQDCDFGCRVLGDSTIRAIKPGAIIVCKEIMDKELLPFGDIFLVVTKENRWLRIVRKHEQKDYLLLKSQNPDYDDIDCPKEKILRLFAVKVIINQEQM